MKHFLHTCIVTTDDFEDGGSSFGAWHFLTIFILLGVAVVVGYLCVHNRKKVGVALCVNEKLMCAVGMLQIGNTHNAYYACTCTCTLYMAIKCPTSPMFLCVQLYCKQVTDFVKAGSQYY